MSNSSEAMLSIGALFSASMRVARLGRVAVSGAFNRPRNSAFSPLPPSCGQSRSTMMVCLPQRCDFIR